jgi:replicative superfamily II helicase
MIQIEEKTDDPVINISLDTLNKKKQLLSFFNTKRSAEASAERIAAIIEKKEETSELDEIARKIEKTLSSPTKQMQKTCKSGPARSSISSFRVAQRAESAN